MKNQILIVFDSLRWDIFKQSDAPFLKSLGRWKKAYTQGTYTLPAHMSFFIGKLPTTFDEEDYYDTVATRYSKKEKRTYRNTKQLWRLANPEAPRPSKYTLEGENIISGFREKGYFTIGTGGVNWFNPDLPAGRILTAPFETFRFFGGPQYASHVSAEYQIAWVLDCVRNAKSPYFLFINFGETHHRFLYKNCSWSGEKNPYGDSRECRRRQRGCIEYLSTQIETLLEQLSDYDLVICSDHGEAMGEDGLWGHGFYHKTILEVPLLVKVSGEV
jgi:arylsulfatase A-like enzyme